MTFWILAVALLAVSAAVIAWPFFKGTVRQRFAGLWLLLMIPIAGLALYQFVGNPVAINPPPVAAGQQHSIEDMLAKLEKRMQQEPDNVDGWVLLGRTYKSLRRFSDAEKALDKASKLAPKDPLIMVELAETRLMAAEHPAFTPEIRQLLTTALEIDPAQQKGLWLMGLASSIDGDDAKAVGYWQKLLAEIDPGTPVANAVRQQINEARKRLGQAPVEAPAAAAGPDIPVKIDIAADLKENVPDSAVLFVFIHPAGAGGGMPLGVKRVASPEFPLELHISNADVLRPGTKLQDYEQLSISARISLRGVANASSGDLQSKPYTFTTKAAKAIALNIDQRVP